MKRNAARNVPIRGLALLALGALCILPTPVRAQGMTGYVVIFPSLGLAPDQSLRLTLFNRDGAPVRAQVRIHHAFAVVKLQDAAVRAGAFHSFEFKRSDIALPGESGSGRLQLSASLHLALAGPRKKLDKLSVSMETISNSDGLSSTLFTGERLPDPISGGSGNDSIKSGFGNDIMMGIVPGQTLRVTLYNPPSFRPKARRNPVTGRVKFFDGSGNLIAQSDESAIPPGEFRSFDLDRDALSLPGELGTGRLQTRGRWSLMARDASGQVAASFELIDNLTGKTVVLSGQECLVFFLGGVPK